jgi:hypothetical protein
MQPFQLSIKKLWAKKNNKKSENSVSPVYCNPSPLLGLKRKLKCAFMTASDYDIQLLRDYLQCPASLKL